MKALEKDRQRRYETANGLAMDIQTSAGDAVLPPPGTAYRFKFVRRNRLQVMAAAPWLRHCCSGWRGQPWRRSARRRIGLTLQRPRRRRLSRPKERATS